MSVTTAEQPPTTDTRKSPPPGENGNTLLWQWIEDSPYSSQADLARKLGLERTIINGYVRKGKKPSVSRLVDMASALEVSPEELNEAWGFGLVLEDQPVLTLPNRIKELEKQVAELFARLAP